MLLPQSMTHRSLLLWLFLLTSAGCEKPPPHITYIVPDGFRGVIKIRAERPTGVVSKTSHGDFILAIPESGELEIVEQLPTKTWHQKVAKYRGGQVIETAKYDGQVPDNGIALRPVIRLSGTEEWFVIGTLDDARAALKKARGSTVPPTQ